MSHLFSCLRFITGCLKNSSFLEKIMSANQSHTPDGHGIMLYSGETVLVFTREVNLSFKSAPEHFFKGKKIGNLYLTTHRIIFLATDGGELKSLAMPFICIDNVQLEQPIFGANYLEGIVSAQPGGNFEGEVVWKLSFNRGGCIDFGKALKQAVSLGRSYKYISISILFSPTNATSYCASTMYVDFLNIFINMLFRRSTCK
jgi:hypothetical protein